MATWILQDKEIKKQRENQQYLNLKYKKFWRFLIFIWMAEYVVCCSYGNSYCQSKYVVSCCDVTFKALQHIKKTFGEVVKDAKSTHR